MRLEVGRAGAARVKRIIYPPGFRWSVDIKPSVGTDLCMHAHVGFLASGEIHIEYADGCIVEHKAPQFVHRTWTRRLGRGQETCRPDRIRLREGLRSAVSGMPDAHPGTEARGWATGEVVSYLFTVVELTAFLLAS